MTKNTGTDTRPQRFRRCTDVRYRVVGGQAVIIVQGAGEAVVLNEVGTCILELIDQGRSRDEIVAGITGRFEADSDCISEDLDRYLADLEDAGVIELNPTGQRRA